jgi:hypothetical protein
MLAISAQSWNSIRYHTGKCCHKEWCRNRVSPCVVHWIAFDPFRIGRRCYALATMYALFYSTCGCVEILQRWVQPGEYKVLPVLEFVRVRSWYPIKAIPSSVTPLIPDTDRPMLESLFRCLGRGATFGGGLKKQI